jgi:hypothetical protein
MESLEQIILFAMPAIILVCPDMRFLFASDRNELVHFESWSSSSSYVFVIFVRYRKNCVQFWYSFRVLHNEGIPVIRNLVIWYSKPKNGRRSFQSQTRTKCTTKGYSATRCFHVCIRVQTHVIILLQMFSVRGVHCSDSASKGRGIIVDAIPNAGGWGMVAGFFGHESIRAYSFVQ